MIWEGLVEALFIVLDFILIYSSQEVFYASLNVITHAKTREGYQLLHMLRSYLDMESLFDLDLHTETTLEMFSQELMVWSAKLEVSNQELQIAGHLTQNTRHILHV